MRSTSRVLFTLVAGIVGVLLTGIPHAEAAKKKIAVLDIEGARSADLRESVEGIVKKKHGVVAGRAYAKAARKLKAKRMNDRSVKKVATYLEVDGVLEGMLVAEEDGYVLRLRLREGATGRTVRKFTVFLRSPRMTRKIRKELSKRLYAAIDGLEPIAADEPEEDWEEDWDDGEEVREDAPKRDRRTARRSRRDKKKKARARDFVEEAGDDDKANDDDDWGDDDELDEDKDEPRRRSRDRDDDDDDKDDRRARRDRDRDDDRDIDSKAKVPRDKTGRNPALTVSVGAAVIGRELTFSAREDLMVPPQEYIGAYAPGVYVTGELFPMAASKGSSPIKNVGFGFDVERSVGLSSQVTGEGIMEPINLPTQRERYGFRAAYRYHFGSKATQPTVTLSAGYNKLSFTIDQTDAPEGIVIAVPNVEYTYVDPGLKLRLPLNKAIAVIAEGKFMAVLDAGDIVLPEQYGAATVTGADADVALQYRTGGNWLITAGGHYTMVGYSFKPGAGELSSGTDGDIDSLDVGGALDKYLGGYITAGYAY